jgi:STIP1 family protein 1
LTRYLLAQAHLSSNHPQQALDAAQTAYTQVLYPHPTTKSSPNDLQTFSLYVLRCKKAIFTSRERARLRAQGDLLADLEESLEMKLQQDLAAVSAQLRAPSIYHHSGPTIGPIAATEARAALHAAHETRLSGLRAVFALAQDPSLTPTRREVPDHLVDMITFEPMHDPVVTKNGHSYERATLYEHLKRSPTDPLTREPLSMQDVRSNLGLKAACEEFWASGAEMWIGDW